MCQIQIMETKNIENNTANDAAMDELYSSTLENFIEGSIIEGTILKIVDNNVIIDIGYKSEGTIPLNEFTNLDETPEGKKVEVYLECLEDEDGAIVISKKRAEQQQAWDYVVNECKEGSIIEGVINSAVKGLSLIHI